MKKYCLYPGVGKAPDLGGQVGHVSYITGKMLAFYYRVAYRDCVDMDDPFIRKVASKGAMFDNLIPLIPMSDGIYRIPTKAEKKLILTEGFHQAVKKDG